MKINNTSALHTYLKEKGLEYTEATVKQYWTEYRRKWQNQKRKEQKTYTIFCSKQEQAVFTKAAINHSLSITTLIKQSSLAYLKQQFLQIDSATISEIKQTLTLMYSSVIHTLDEERISQSQAIALLQKIESIEQTILLHIESPKLQS